MRKYEASPNLLASLFPLYQNHIWITDFTYLKWMGRWVFVCTVIDLFSREVIGLSIRTNHNALLVSEALLNALMQNPTPLIIHSDLGSEYKSIYYYNHDRIHTSLKMSPKQFSEKFAQKEEIKYNTSQERLTV